MPCPLLRGLAPCSPVLDSGPSTCCSIQDALSRPFPFCLSCFLSFPLLSLLSFIVCLFASLAASSEACFLLFCSLRKRHTNLNHRLYAWVISVAHLAILLPQSTAAGTASPR